MSYNGYRVSGLQDEKSSGDSLHDKVNLLDSSELKTGEDGKLCMYFTTIKNNEICREQYIYSVR